MPAYNAEKYIVDSIESVLSQTYKNWELLIVDDNSTDNTENIVKFYLGDPRIRLFKNTKNLGPAKSRNLGLDNAKGDYITFLDSDDFIHKDKLNSQLLFMKLNNFKMTHGNYFFCNSNRDILKRVVTSEKIDYHTLLRGNQFKIMTVLIERKVIEDLRFPDVKHEDYAFYLECMKRIPYSYSQKNRTDSYVRIGNISVSSNKFKSALWTWNIYYKYENLGFLRSLYYFLHYVYNGFLKYRFSRKDKAYE